MISTNYIVPWSVGFYWENLTNRLTQSTTLCVLRGLFDLPHTPQPCFQNANLTTSHLSRWKLFSGEAWLDQESKLLNMTHLPSNLSSKLGHLDSKSRWLILHSRKPGQPLEKRLTWSPRRKACLFYFPEGIISLPCSSKGPSSHWYSQSCLATSCTSRDSSGAEHSRSPLQVKPHQRFRPYPKHCFFRGVASGFSKKLSLDCPSVLPRTGHTWNHTFDLWLRN